MTTKEWARAALSRPAFTGISRGHLGRLIEELDAPWTARCESALHDQTGVRTEGIAEQFRLHPGVRAEADEGYRGLANEFPDQVSAPPKKPKEDVPLGEQYAWREQRRRQSSARICVEHANAEYKQWRPLERFLGRREHYAATHRAVADLVSDRAAQRATRHSRAPNSCPSA
ncbi:transposase [Kitasatospora sp. NPDC101183]|uniref:transposase n=1 Tax=Kitasatospora sp. NPDC101183 TaxID=3364100 RepID=UPI00381A91E8